MPRCPDVSLDEKRATGKVEKPIDKSSIGKLASESDA
jgi:hypothetical protein